MRTSFIVTCLLLRHTLGAARGGHRRRRARSLHGGQLRGCAGGARPARFAGQPAVGSHGHQSVPCVLPARAWAYARGRARHRSRADRRLVVSSVRRRHVAAPAFGICRCAAADSAVDRATGIRAREDGVRTRRIFPPPSHNSIVCCRLSQIPIWGRQPGILPSPIFVLSPPGFGT